MKKRKPLKPSFVVTVAAGTVAFATSGCFGEVTTNPPYVEPECPEALPSAGSPCEEEMTCEYDSECGPLETTCEEGKWSAAREPLSCNPPPIECPETEPAEGGDCTPGWGGNVCYYTDECGQTYLEATCGEAGWALEYVGGTCNPPAPCEYLGVDGCGFDPTCVWHTPGCGDETIPALPQAGCFTATGCATDADCLVGTCQQVMVTPDCVEEGCAACGVAVMLCVQ